MEPDIHCKVVEGIRGTVEGISCMEDMQDTSGVLVAVAADKKVEQEVVDTQLPQEGMVVAVEEQQVCKYRI